jgi:hypothetical protein
VKLGVHRYHWKAGVERGGDDVGCLDRITATFQDDVAVGEQLAYMVCQGLAKSKVGDISRSPPGQDPRYGDAPPTVEGSDKVFADEPGTDDPDADRFSLLCHTDYSVTL